MHSRDQGHFLAEWRAESVGVVPRGRGVAAVGR